MGFSSFVDVLFGAGCAERVDNHSNHEQLLSSRWHLVYITSVVETKSSERVDNSSNYEQFLFSRWHLLYNIVSCGNEELSTLDQRVRKHRLPPHSPITTQSHRKAT